MKKTTTSLIMAAVIIAMASVMTGMGIKPSERRDKKEAAEGYGETVEYKGAPVIMADKTPVSERSVEIRMHILDEDGVALVQIENNKAGFRKTIYRAGFAKEEEAKKAIDLSFPINTNGSYNIYAYDTKAQTAAYTMEVYEVRGGDIEAYRRRAKLRSVFDYPASEEIKKVTA